MKYTLAILAACLITMMLLAGCGDEGSSFLGFGGSSSNDDIATASLPAGSSSSGTGSSGSSGSGNIGGTVHQPEPATIALLGGGLLAYALLRRKLKKR